MKYLISTQSDCASVLEAMDTYYGYPDESKYTITTSEVLSVSGSDYLVSVPNDYYNRLTEDQQGKCTDIYPSSLNQE